MDRQGCESNANDLINLYELPLLGHLTPMILTSRNKCVWNRTLSFDLLLFLIKYICIMLHLIIGCIYPTF